MKYDILNKEVDIAGKIRYWIDIGNGETQILKFDKEPTKTKIKEIIDNFLHNKQNEDKIELQRIKEEINMLEESKGQLETKIK